MYFKKDANNELSIWQKCNLYVALVHWQVARTKKTYEILRFRSYVLKKIISSFGRYNGRQTDGQYDRQDKKHYASDIQKVCVWGGGGIKLNHIHRLADVLKINQIPVQLQSSFQLKLPNQIYFWLNSILYSCRRISNLGDFSVTGKCHRPNTSS